MKLSDPTAMNTREKRATVALASIMSLRMLGLFMILPIFALYAKDYTAATPFLIGMAIGIYGLTQALLQIPMGLLSDRWGRKPIITIGLLIFALGSVVAALSTSIYGVILGRALQGAGAIAAAILALTADLTRESHRTKAMAMLGMSIGMAFISALILGPILSAWIGLAGIFWLIAGLALMGIVILHIGIPTPQTHHLHRDAEAVPTQFAHVLRHPQLLRLDFGILTLHCLLTSLFIIVPLSLQQHIESAQQAWVYLPIMLLSIAIMIPFIIIAEKYQRLKPVFIGAVAALFMTQLSLYWLHASFIGVIVILVIFFSAFNVLEASLPSLISKIAPADSKGTAMGVYASSQFLGAFLGGLIGGWLHQHYAAGAVFLFGATLSSIWLLLAVTMQTPPHYSHHLLNIGQLDPHQARLLNQELLKIVGVVEATVVAEEHVAYLKIDKKHLNFSDLDAFSMAAEQVS